MEQKAADVVDDILKNHSVDPLSEAVQKKIKAIVRQEQDWIDSK